MKMEYRKLGKIRSDSITEEGIVEAYLTAWDTVDSYTTSFQRGCFKRTFAERGHKIRLIWNHEKLAGKVIECREDDYGPFVRVQFNLDTQIGRESFAHVRDGDIDSFSFGFNVVDDEIINKIRTFTEVKVMECGPVIFEANGAAKIVDARAEEFEQTIADTELSNRGWKLFCGLERTLDDIFWNSKNTMEEVMSKIDTAISDFHGAYISWLAEYYNQFGKRADTIKQLTRKGNILQEALKDTGNSKNIIRETSLTDVDFDRLKDGKLLLIGSRDKLSELPENIQEAHKAHRRNTVESFCSEIREMGFSEAEKQRFAALLSFINEEEVDVETVLNSLDILQNSIKKEI